MNYKLFLALPVLVALGWALLYDIMNPVYPVNPGGVILVTGSSSGIGFAASLALANSNYYVLAGVRRETDGARLQKMFDSNKKGTIEPIILDVTSESQCAAAIKRAVEVAAERGIAFTGLVNNAGVTKDLPQEFMSMEDIRWVYDVNLFGAMDLARLAIPYLRVSKGRIVNIGSLASFMNEAGAVAYSSSKSALEGWTDSLRRELYHHQVSVSLVQPGCVSSDIFRKTIVHDKGEYPKVVKGLRASADDAIQQYGTILRNKLSHYTVCEATAWSPGDSTDPAILDAFASERPKSKYLVAGFDGIPAQVLRLLAWALPDRLLDEMMRQPVQPMHER